MQITLIIVLISGVLLAAFFLLNTMGSNKVGDQVQELVAQSADPTVSTIPFKKKEIEALLDEVKSPTFGKNREAVYRTLSIANASDGTDIDRLLSELATGEDLNEEVRIQLLKVIEKREGASALPSLVDFLSHSEDPRSTVAAINAIAPILTVEEVSELFKLISFTNSEEIRVAAERAVKTFAEDNQDSSRVEAELGKAYQAAQNASAQNSYLRLLGVMGGQTAEEVIKQAVQSENDSVRISAYKALQEWPDDTALGVLIDGLANETDSEMHQYAFDAVIRFLTEGKEMNTQAKVRNWKRIVDETKSDKQKATIIQSLGKTQERWALPILHYYLEDENDDVTFLSEQAMESIQGGK